MKKMEISNLHSLSEQSQVPYTTLKGFYNRGTDNVQLSTLEKLSEFFEISIDKLTRSQLSEGINGKEKDLFNESNEFDEILLNKVKNLTEDGKKAVIQIMDNMEKKEK